jgi:hypothetical protein
MVAIELVRSFTTDGVQKGGDNFQLVLNAKLERDTMEALIAYTDWAATWLFREKKFGVQRLPDPDEASCERIANRAAVPVSRVARVITLLWLVPRIPLLGSMKGELLRPNKKTILRWAEFYDWGPPVVTTKRERA